MTAIRQRHILLFQGAQTPTAQQVTALIDTQTGIERAYLARSDDWSARACQWQRAPYGSLPTGRLSIDWADAPDESLLQQLQQQLGGLRFACTSREPLALELTVGSTWHGSLQLCLFSRRSGLSDEQLRQAWWERHTAIALTTQSTRGYWQNWVEGIHPDPNDAAAPLEPFGAAIDGMVEEYFPPEAADSLMHFFNADGDPQRLREHIQKLTESSATFLDPDTITVAHLTDTRLR